MSRAYGTEHFLVAGASGSGKTTIINTLLKSVGQTPFTGIVYDPKQELLPLLFWMAKEAELSIAAGGHTVKVLHPLDDRCCAWDMAKDIDSPIHARQLASILVPESASTRATESFFIDAARDLLTGVLLAFIACIPNAKEWTFRDVILTMLYEPYLRYVLNYRSTREGLPIPTLDRLRASYLDSNDPRTVANVRSSVNARLSIFEPIAAAWDAAVRTNCGRRFSLREWENTNRPQILVLGNDETARTSLDAINQAIFKRATEIILGRPDPKSDADLSQHQYWVFLDEVRMAGRLDGLGRLMTNGRSKGACVVLGFQDISGLRDAYGPEVANEIMAQCNNVAILRLNSPETTQWASQLFGKRKLVAENKSVNFGIDGKSQISSGTGEHELPYLFSADFAYLPNPKTAGAVEGYLKTPQSDPQVGISELKFRVGRDVDQYGNPDKTTGCFSSFLPSDPMNQYLAPWSSEDWDRLGFAPPFTNLLEHKQVTSSSQPSCQPSTQPSSQPSSQPNTQPSTQPSSQPSSQETGSLLAKHLLPRSIRK